TTLGNWRYAASSGYAYIMNGSSDGKFSIITSNSSSTASSSEVGSVSTKLTIDSAVGIVPRVPIVSTESAQFTSMTCSSLVTTGTISCGTNSISCGSITSTALSTSSNGNVNCGINNTSTSRTNNFISIPATAGVPTGVVTNPTGLCSMTYDTSNNRLYV